VQSPADSRRACTIASLKKLAKAVANIQTGDGFSDGVFPLVRLLKLRPSKVEKKLVAMAIAKGQKYCIAEARFNSGGRAFSLSQPFLTWREQKHGHFL